MVRTQILHDKKYDVFFFKRIRQNCLAQKYREVAAVEEEWRHFKKAVSKYLGKHAWIDGIDSLRYHEGKSGAGLRH